MFSAALLSTLGASQLTACGGTVFTTTSDGGTGAGGSAGAGTAGHGVAGANTAGADTAGSGGASAAGGDGPAGAGGGSSAGAGGEGNSDNHYPCQNPMDLGNGLVTCTGFRHRAKSVTCASKVPRPEPFPTTSPSAQCKADADCVARPYGWCGAGGQVPGPYCSYGCVKDSDCAANQLCECGDPVGRCVQADCKLDADCKPGFLCKGYDASGGCGINTFTCQSSADGCGSDADCTDTKLGNLCRFDLTAQHFKCEFGGCAIGRPFLVEGAARLAPAATRADWQEFALLPRVDALDGALRAELAIEWTRVALMEHASIAAFARFTLQLLSVGAPPELVQLATAAMTDETKHARACFALAGAYAGEPVGPGPLAIDGSLDRGTLTGIVLNTIREGCVGETIAAIEAREGAAYASDPALRQLLATIAEDETRHAELAFRFVGWALSGADAGLERAVREELAALRADAARVRAVEELNDERLLQHGIVPTSLGQLIRSRALTEVIVPWLSALTSPKGRAQPASEKEGAIAVPQRSL